MSTLESALEIQSAGSLQGVRYERFPTNHIHGDFIYERFRVNRRNYWYLRYKTKPFEDELGYDEFRAPGEVIHNIQPGGEVIFVKPVRGRDIGKEIAVATQELRVGVLVTGVKIVRREYQGKGIGTHLAEDAILRHKPTAATGKTRNWRVIRAYEQLEYQGQRLIERIPPIDTEHEVSGTAKKVHKLSDEAKEVLKVVLFPKELEGLDLETGLYPADTYPRIADFRDFRVPRNPHGVRIYNAMREVGINPAIGNGLRYYAEVNQEVLERASAAYHPREVVVFPEKSLPRRIFAAIMGMSILVIPGPSFKK